MRLKSQMKKERSYINNDLFSPEKLTHRLKMFTSAILLNRSRSPSREENNASIEADDVIYYAGANLSKDRLYTSNNAHRKEFKRCDSTIIRADESMNSLEEIHQLYKSVPNICAATSGYYYGNPHSEVSSKVKIRKSTYRLFGDDRNSQFLSESPTDSGYRSNTRPECAYAAELCVRTQPLPDFSRRYSNIYEGQSTIDKTNYTDLDLGKEVHQATIVLVNAEPSACDLKGSISTHDDKNSQSQASSVTATISSASERLSYHEYSATDITRSLKDSNTDTSGINPRRQFLFDESDLKTFLLRGRCKDIQVAPCLVTKIVDFVNNQLFRIANEVQRLSSALVKCRPQDIKSAAKIVLGDTMANDCMKAAIQATSIYALSGTGALKMSMSRRAGLHLNLGRFYSWMIENDISKAICDEAAVFFCAVIDCLFEENIIKYAAAKTTDDDNCELDLFQSSVIRGSSSFNSVYTGFQNANDTESLMSTWNSFEEVVKSAMRTCSTQSNESRPKIESTPMKLSKTALMALWYYYMPLGSDKIESGHLKADSLSLSTLLEWIHIATIFTSHRSSSVIDDDDIRQAARILLPANNCPPRNFSPSSDLTVPSAEIYDQKVVKRSMAFQLLQNDSSEVIKYAYGLLGPSRHRIVNEYGLSPLSEAVINRRRNAVYTLLELGADPNVGVPFESSPMTPFPLSEFAGWTPITWAVTQGSVKLIDRLVRAGGNVEQPSMIKETPLQLAVMMNNSQIAMKLMSFGANPFRSSISYDSMKCNFRNMGSPSALAIAAAQGKQQAVRAMLSKASCFRRSDECISLTDFLSESDQNSASSRYFSGKKRFNNFFDSLNREQRLSLLEALYYSTETGHLSIAMDLRSLGVPWNIHTWTKCAEGAIKQQIYSIVNTILIDFDRRLCEDISYETVDDAVYGLMNVLRTSCVSTDIDSIFLTSKISDLFEHLSGDGLNELKESSSQVESHSKRTIIDMKYVNNSDFSDIRFKVQNRVVFAHRIVLINASKVFKELLSYPKTEFIVQNIDYNTFMLILEFVYCGVYTKKHSEQTLVQQMVLIEAAVQYDLRSLVDECVRTMARRIDPITAFDIYNFALAMELEDLGSAAEMFVLRNIEELAKDARFTSALRKSTRYGTTDICERLAKKLIAIFNDRKAKLISGTKSQS